MCLRGAGAPFGKAGPREQGLSREGIDLRRWAGEVAIVSEFQAVALATLEAVCQILDTLDPADLELSGFVMTCRGLVKRRTRHAGTVSRKI